MAKKKTAKKKTATKKAATKKAPAKKKAAAKKKVPAKKAAAKKKAPAKKAAAKKKAPAKKAAAKKKAPAKKAPAKKLGKVKKTSAGAASVSSNGHSPVVIPKGPIKLSPFFKAQKQRLLDLRDSMVDAIAGVAQDTLRGSDGADTASATGMHQADAGSDAYDRDFALNLLSQEQDALYEIDEALGRLKIGTYGICEISGKKIMKERLEAIPFARYTVECQAQLERENGGRGFRRPIRPQLFDSESGVDSDGE